MNHTRRSFIVSSMLVSMQSLKALPTLAARPERQHQRSAGLLWGTLIGDAMGGPLEFATPEKRQGHVVDARNWPESKRLDKQTIAAVAKRAMLMTYKDVRPGTAAYGPWVKQAAAGTVTDDSRFKIILIRAIRAANRQGATSVTRSHLAKAILEFSPRVDQAADKETQKLIDEGLREYRYAANWVLGNRDPEIALPLDRLWGGIPNCSGQMLLLPIALQFPDRAEAAYRASFELNFVDGAGAKDIASAIVAGLASVIGNDAPTMTSNRRWEKLETTMRTVDPFRLKDVPFAGRPLHKWMDLADSIVKRANGRPSVAYELLETDGKPVYYWDAHFTLLVALTLLKISQYNALCALHLAIDFGHDTDSYAQLIGAMAGAVYGAEVFPNSQRQTVAARLLADYGEDTADWVELLSPANEKKTDDN